MTKCVVIEPFYATHKGNRIHRGMDKRTYQSILRHSDKYPTGYNRSQEMARRIKAKESKS